MPGIYSVHDAIIGVQSALGGRGGGVRYCCATSSRPTAPRGALSTARRRSLGRGTRWWMLRTRLPFRQMRPRLASVFTFGCACYWRRSRWLTNRICTLLGEGFIWRARKWRLSV